MQVRQYTLASAVALSLSMAFPAFASPLAVGAAARTAGAHHAAAEQAQRSEAAAAAKSSANQAALKAARVRQESMRRSALRRHHLRDIGRASRNANSDGRSASHRDFGWNRAKDRNDLDHMQRLDSLRHHRHRWHEFARHHRHDRRGFAWRERDHRFARDWDHRRSEFAPSESAKVNSNGWFAADRDFGRDRAADRHSLHRAGRLEHRRLTGKREEFAAYDHDRFARRHEYARHDRDGYMQRDRDRDDNLARDNGHRVARGDDDHRRSEFAPSESAKENSNGWFAAERKFGRDRVAERHELRNSAERTLARGESGRFDRDDRATQRTVHEKHPIPRFVNVTGESSSSTLDRDDYAR